MRVFTEEGVNKYLEYVDEWVIPVEELEGHCHHCGVLLIDTKLPDSPLSKVCCLNCIETFTEYIEDIEEEGFNFN